ncbi:unnamed protein product [Effrenium voratum]|uniref:Uncharacterized protein n=1 Tax=Effrenium voratum TaxID=2562239 RepID=A0AA36I5J6_9DINO|nr:unnamed protein product [Effrenium voratum]CAJ1420928.1 unnamed protein product [Effrenium voratum]
MRPSMRPPCPRALAVASVAALGALGAFAAAAAALRRRRKEGPWLLRGVTLLDDLSASGWRQADVLLGATGHVDLLAAARHLLAPKGWGVIEGEGLLLLPGEKVTGVEDGLIEVGSVATVTLWDLSAARPSALPPAEAMLAGPCQALRPVHSFAQGRRVLAEGRAL